MNKQITQITRLLITATISILASSVNALGQVASAKVPQNLQVPDKQDLLFKTLGKGIQIYVCQPKANAANQYEWVFKAPEAELFDLANQQKFARHYAGPTWEAIDGSKVIAKVEVNDKAPVANAIPWLLLKVKSYQGDGIFTKVNYVQRLNTVGGTAPRYGCDSSDVGRQIGVNYTANYYFYGSN